MVLLKDRLKKRQDEKEEDKEKKKLWYDRAFGSLRNMMKIELSFTPPDIPPGRFAFIAYVNYQMFPELEEEFNQEDYKSGFHTLEVDVEENVVEYFLELEVPYGKAEFKIFVKDLEALDSSEPPTPLDDKYLPYFRDHCVPEPISRERQRELDDQEEKDNKEKEREARQAQKELEQRKARQKAEAQNQLLKQEKNSAKLKVYFNAMDLYFHKQEEDFNASMSLLSIFHEELHNNFSFYTHSVLNFYNRPENYMIPLQGFFHFCRLLNLANSAEELMSFFDQSLREIDGIYVPVDDTLNCKGGMNYAQFLQALLLIAYIKAEKSGDQSNQAYKNALDAMLQNPKIDIQKRQIEDPILGYVYQKDTVDIFKVNEISLSALFTEKSI